MLLLGNANGNREYLSITVSKCLFLLEEGKRSLKSILSLSIGWVALVKRISGGLQNFGLISAQTLHSFHHITKSSNENGRFLDLKK